MVDLPAQTPADIHIKTITDAIALAATEPEKAITPDVYQALASLSAKPESSVTYQLKLDELASSHKALSKTEIRKHVEIRMHQKRSNSGNSIHPSDLSELSESDGSSESNCPTNSATGGDNPPNKPDELGQNEIGREIANKLRNRLAWDSTAGNWFERPKLSMPFTECEDPLDAWMTIKNELSDYRSKFSAGFVSGVETFVRAELRVPKWQDDRKFLPMKNGVLCLDTKTLREHSEQDRYNWQLPYCYDPSATCPLIDKTIGRMVNKNADLERFLMAWLVIVLLGYSNVQAFIELIGGGGTGKSTFLRLAAFLVGEENTQSTDLDALENNRFETANIYGKRLTLVSDSARYRGEVPVLKALTGGDPIRLERKYMQQRRPYVYDGLVMIAANQPLESTDYSSGLQRRRRSIRIDYRVTEAEKAPYRDREIYPDGFEGALREEMSGLLNKLLALDVTKQVSLIANPDAAMRQQRLNVELDTNPLLAWADDHLVRLETNETDETKAINAGHTIKVGTLKNSADDALYPSYAEFCESRGNHPRSIVKFSADLADGLRDYGIDTSSRRGKVTHMVGLRLRKPKEDDYQTVPRLISDSGEKSPNSTTESKSRRVVGQLDGAIVEFGQIGQENKFSGNGPEETAGKGSESEYVA